MSDVRPDTHAEGLRAAVRAKYAEVAGQPVGHFPYPIGREGALALGYDATVLGEVAIDVVDRFVGVGNPLGIERPAHEERVLDLGCGCGLDVLVAARLVGDDGYVVGVDLTPEMVALAQGRGRANVHLQVGSVEALPFEDGSFDRVISNGALNLVPDKAAAFAEAFRVLRPGGRFVVADLLVTETVPEEVLASLDAWST